MSSLQNVYQQAEADSSMQPPLAQEQRQQDGSMSHFQNNQINAFRANCWTVEQTAAWVRRLGFLRHWLEAEVYGNSFQSNEIKGWMLQHLTINSLKSELSISSYGHRLELMHAIKCLFEERGLTPDSLSNSVDVMLSPMALTRADWDNAVSPMSTSSSPPMNVGTPRNRQQPGGSEWSFVEGSDMWGIISSSINSVQASGVGSLVSESLGVTAHHKEIVATSKKCGRDPVEVLTHKVKSERGKPSSPLFYKALCELEVRTGRSANTNIVGHLREGAVIVINQVKSRFGRLVEKRNGEYHKVGWVPFCTREGQPCLVRYFPEENE